MTWTRTEDALPLPDNAEDRTRWGETRRVIGRSRGGHVAICYWIFDPFEPSELARCKQADYYDFDPCEWCDIPEGGASRE